MIKIDEENDNAPIFTQMIVSPDHDIQVSSEDETSLEKFKDMTNDHHSPLLFVPENSTIGTMIIRLVAQDKDEIDNGKITYAIKNETIISMPTKKSNFNNLKSHFIIDSKSGELSVSRLLSPGWKFHLNIIAKDSANHTDNITIKITSVDVNDHSPVFKKSWYEFNIPEGVYKNHEIGEVTAIDMDMNENARITYKLNSTYDHETSLIFDIDKITGILRITGDLDREIRETYKLVVTANDNGKIKMSSSVNIEINILDTNDNPPVFHGYTDTMYNENNNNQIPIYYASVTENTPIGTVISRINANDSDFIGNGNGLILYDLSYTIGENQYFTINSKDGDITTISKLNYESQNIHNVTIIARDLGSPSLTSTAMLHVRVLDVDEPLENEQQILTNKPVFQHRYYELEIEENSIVPIKLLQLNVTDYYKNSKIKYSTLFYDDDYESNDYFTIDSDNGTLILVKKVDREYRDIYEFKVKVDWGGIKIGRGLPVMIYPIIDDRLGDLKLNEAKIVVRVKDTNDNAPRFRTKGRPLLAAIPASINYGHEIIKIEVFPFFKNFFFIIFNFCHFFFSSFYLDHYGKMMEDVKRN